MSDQLITSTETTVIIPEIWSQKFYDVLLAKLPFIASVSKDYEGEISNLGDIVNISTIPEFDAADELAENAAGQANSVTLTGQQLTINKRVYKDYIVTKKAQLQSLPFMDQLRDKAVYSIQKKMHALIVADIVPSASAPDHQIAYDSSTTLALADILEAQELLNAQNVPMEGRYGVVGSAQYSDVFNITGYTSKDFVPAGSPLSTGSFEFPLAGFDIRPTTLVGTTSYWAHPSFMTMAVQQNLNIEVFNLGSEGKRASRVNIDLLFGIKQLDNKRVVSIS